MLSNFFADSAGDDDTDEGEPSDALESYILK